MSCLFNSLSKLLQDEKVNSYYLRQNICDYISKNEIIFGGMTSEQIIFFESNTTLNSYVRKMRKNSTWGGSLEMKVFCDLYSKNIIVHYNGRNIEFLTEKPDSIFHLKYYGNHYEELGIQELWINKKYV